MSTVNLSESAMTKLLYHLMQENQHLKQQQLPPLQSAETNEVYEAFAQAQAEFPSLPKDSRGYNYTYADLGPILEKIEPLLNKHGLHFSQYGCGDNTLITRIGHESGQYFSSRLKVPLPSEHTKDPKLSYMQQLGSNITYARRYEACSILGVQPHGDDTDGR